jgi:hypothetical protein
MKSLINFIKAIMVWYAIFTLICWSYNPHDWHWIARFFCFILAVATFIKLSEPKINQ